MGSKEKIDLSRDEREVGEPGYSFGMEEFNNYGKGGFLPLAASSPGKDLAYHCRSRTDETVISSIELGALDHARELGDLVCLWFNRTQP